jgi:hypothetical protein
MPNVQIPINQSAFNTLHPSAPLSSLTLTISSTAMAYLAAIAAGENGHQIVPRQTATGTTTVTITANAKDAQGTPLAPVVMSYDIVGNPAPPVTVTFGTPQVGTFPLPPDPGTATVVLI